MRHTQRRLGSAAFTAAVLLVSGCANPGSETPEAQTPEAQTAQPVGTSMDQASMDRTMASWSEASRKAVAFMTDKYGPPAEMTASMAVWNETGPWKRTIVYSEEIQHDFPMPHPDVMEQFIDYSLAPEMYDEMAMYDGSVIVERTKGEMSARCDKEPANFLALNLANEIATGERTVEDARRMYAEQIKAMMAGQPAPYTEGLMFTPPATAGYTDQAVM